jgi:hypothetical protein
LRHLSWDKPGAHYGESSLILAWENGLWRETIGSQVGYGGWEHHPFSFEMLGYFLKNGFQQAAATQIAYKLPDHFGDSQAQIDKTREMFREALTVGEGCGMPGFWLTLFTCIDEHLQLPATRQQNENVVATKFLILGKATRELQLAQNDIREMGPKKWLAEKIPCVFVGAYEMVQMTRFLQWSINPPRETMDMIVDIRRQFFNDRDICHRMVEDLDIRRI